MNKFGVPLLFTAIIYVVYKLLAYKTQDNITPLLVFLIPIFILGLNLLMRKKLRFKKWFLSKWNFLLEKKSFEFETDIPFDLVLPKLGEVVSSTNYKILETDEEKLMLLVGTSASFWSWGENIYICIEQKNKACQIKFDSVTVFGSSSLGKHDQHFKKISLAFESSLTI